jgi:hypothetical protein
MTCFALSPDQVHYRVRRHGRSMNSRPSSDRAAGIGLICDYGSSPCRRPHDLSWPLPVGHASMARAR